jgi:GlpG protein
MRQLATLPNADTARILADYLLTLHISTKVEQQPEGWAIWVHDEDRLPQARQELDEFNRAPHDPRYTDAARTAEALRREKRDLENSYHRRQDRFNRRMSGPLASVKITVGLIAISVLVSLLSAGGHDRKIVQALSIARYTFSDPWMFSPGLRPISQGEVWRLVTPIFLHIGIWHLFFDMYMLYLLGGLVERGRGPVRYLLLVLVLAVVSNLVQYFLGHPSWDGSALRLYRHPNFGGMSGVVYGLLGYIWMKARFHPQLGLHIQPNTVIFLMVWLVLCMTPAVEFIFGSSTANGAHLGGLIAGMLIGYVPTLWHSFPSD